MAKTIYSCIQGEEANEWKEYRIDLVTADLAEVKKHQTEVIGGAGLDRDHRLVVTRCEDNPDSRDVKMMDLRAAVIEVENNIVR